MFLEVAQCGGTGCVRTSDLLGSELEIGFVSERPGAAFNVYVVGVDGVQPRLLPQHSLSSMRHCNIEAYLGS